MIELNHDSLIFSFPDVHEDAQLTVNFQRTLRIPDDDRTYPLPPGLGRFPVRHVDDFAKSVPPPWMERGGVMLPMYQSEAMWLLFGAKRDPERGSAYPFAIKIAAGKVDAVTGESWSDSLGRSPQDYMVAPKQPWLDGYCVEKGTIRQFVAMPLGDGYTAEEQITGKAEHGGLQIIAYPMKREVYERRFPKRPVAPGRFRANADLTMSGAIPCAPSAAAPDMGLAPGGRMTQTIYDDPFDADDWDLEHSSRCFVHISNSLAWRAITGKEPPSTPLSATEYQRCGLPWFEHYADGKALGAMDKLKNLFSISELATQKGTNPLPENESVVPDPIIKLREGLKEGQVREGSF